MSKELTFKEVKDHNSKKDLYVVVHDKVYDCTSFVDEHPGGEEVILDVGGLDATEAFEDVGHSDEAREILDGLLVGNLRRTADDPPAPKGATDKVSAGPNPGDSGSGVALYAIVLTGGLLAYAAYVYTSKQEQK